MPEADPSTFMHSDDEEPEFDLVDELLDPDEEVTPSDKLVAIIKLFATRFERDPRHSCHLWRDAPNTDSKGIPCKGFLAALPEVPSEEDLKKRFGGSLYHMLIKGPKRDRDTGKIDIKTVASVRGLMIAGPVRPNPEDKHFQGEAGFKRVQEERALLEAAERKADEDEDKDEAETPVRRPPGPVRSPQAPPGQRPFGPGGLPMGRPGYHQPSGVGGNGDPLADKKLDAEIETQKAQRNRMWEVEDKAREALAATQGGGGMDAETVKALFSEMKSGNQAAVERFSDAIAGSNEKSAEAMARVLEMFQSKVTEPRDDREEQRLKELLDSAQADLRAIRQEQQTELSRVDKAHREEVRSLREARDQAEERVERRLKDTFTQERGGWDHQRDGLQAEVRRLNEKIDAADSRHDEKVKAEEKRGNDRVEALRESHKTALDGIKRDFDTRERMLNERIRDFEGKVDTARGKELELRDAKQTESLGKMKAELQRDSAKAEGERLDLGKVSAAMGVGKQVAEAMGFEKPEKSGPSAWEAIGTKAVEVVGSVATNERFTKLVSGVVGGARDAAAAAREAAAGQDNPQLPPPPAPSPDQLTYDDMVAAKKAERRAELEAQQAARRARANPASPATMPAAPAAPAAPGRQLPPEGAADAQALDVIAAALADEPPGAAPAPATEGLVEPPPPAEVDATGAMIDRMEDLAAENTPPSQALDLVLGEFGVNRTEAKLFIEGKSAVDLLGMMNISPAELSAKARTLLDAALASLG
jgi:hypothetical protein